MKECDVIFVRRTDSWPKTKCLFSREEWLLS